MADTLVPAPIERRASQAVAILAHGSNLTSVQALKRRNELLGLPDRQSNADKINLLERYIYLDLVHHISQGKADFLSERRKKDLQFWLRIQQDDPRRIDFTETIRRGNEWYDKFVDAADLKHSMKEHGDRLNRIDDEIERQRVVLKNWFKRIAAVFTSKDPEKVAGQQMADVLCMMMRPPSISVRYVEAEVLASSDLARLSLELAAYRSDNGTYPDMLEQLVPEYTKSLPTDWFARGAAYRYRRTGNGYTLYSLGLQSKDDGGPDATPDTRNFGIRVGVDE